MRKGAPVENWKSRNARLFLLLGIAAIVCYGCGSHRRTAAGKVAEEAGSRPELLREAILQELSSLPEDHWAGRYYYGDGLGVNVSLDIAPKAGFVFEWHGCLGMYDQNYGEVEERDNEIHLCFELENKREGFQGIAPSFLPVKWGERSYLIASDEIIRFCNAINSGDEPRKSVHGSFLLRGDDYRRRVRGAPPLPEKYIPYLLKRPIKARIIEVHDAASQPSGKNLNFRETVVVLNVGREHGILEGMELGVYSPANAFSSVTVTRIGEDSCEAVMVQFGKEIPLPKVGWKVSTGTR